MEDKNTEQEISVMQSLPRGVIIGWFGDHRIPNGWALCDGLDGRPDLNNRYIYGTTDHGEVGKKIGRRNFNQSISRNTEIVKNDNMSPSTEGAFQKNGPDRHSHYHEISFNINIPLEPEATKILFIIKIS